MSWKKTKRKLKKKVKTSPFLQGLLILLPVALLGGAYFWWNSSVVATGEDQHAVCVLLIDRTGSMGNDLKTLAEGAVTGCEHEKARLIPVYFNQDSGGMQATSGDVLENGFELWAPVKRSDAAREKAQRDQRKTATDAIDDIFAVSPGEGLNSDIIVAMGNAASRLRDTATLDGVTEMHLLIITDGIQRRPSLDVGSFLNGTTPEQLVQAVIALNAIPSLQGIQVTFAGPLQGKTLGGEVLDPGFEEQVAQFWRLIVEQGGGQLCGYSANVALPPASCGGQ